MPRWRPPASPPPASPAWTILLLAALALAGCGGGRTPYDGTDPNAGLIRAPSRFYPPPGPPSDPWGPYITAAADRAGVPPQWVRAVMRQESGGQQQAVSPVGAMGLMQLMPATYEALRARYNLGPDPFEPRDNIAAGTFYLREMYDRYGAPGMLAAYNAGPRRLDDYLAAGTPLPDETVNYLAAIAPNLGPATALSGPLAVYAGGPARASSAPTPRSLAAGCDPDAAFNPDHPCRALEIAARRPAAPAPAFGPPPESPPLPETPNARWAIQVGAFASPDLARVIARRALDEAADVLAAASIETPTVPANGSVLYRARLTNLSAAAARTACSRLNARQLPCIVVSPA